VVVVLSLPLFRAAFPPRVGPGLPPEWVVLAAACPVFFGSLLSGSAQDAS